MIMPDIVSEESVNVSEIRIKKYNLKKNNMSLTKINRLYPANIL
jgi:hypothetical protein